MQICRSVGLQLLSWLLLAGGKLLDRLLSRGSTLPFAAVLVSAQAPDRVMEKERMEIFNGTARLQELKEFVNASWEPKSRCLTVGLEEG